MREDRTKGAIQSKKRRSNGPIRPEMSRNDGQTPFFLTLNSSLKISIISLFVELMSRGKNPHYFTSPPPTPPPQSLHQPSALSQPACPPSLVRGGGESPSSPRVNYCIDQTRPPPALFLGVDHLPEFQPSQVESGMDDRDDTVSEERQGKFLQYWLTTTYSATVSSITKTYTIGSVVCTPPGAALC